MSRIKDKNKAIELRKKGMSYSQIKAELGISKSTLSGWLYNMPLSEKRIKELGAFSPIRIERCRNTKRSKKMARQDSVFDKVSKDIGRLSKRELFLAGLFLYWGEGGKTKYYTTILTNTNPNMVKFFLRWLENLGVDKNKIKVSLHLYSDMDIDKQMKYWSKLLDIGMNQFRKPYIKKSKFTDITYRNGFGQGTCSIIYDNRDLSEYVLQGIKYIEKM